MTVVPLLGSPRSCTFTCWASFPLLPVLSSLLKRTSHGGHCSSLTSACEPRGWTSIEETPFTTRHNIDSIAVSLPRRGNGFMVVLSCQSSWFCENFLKNISRVQGLRQQGIRLRGRLCLSQDWSSDISIKKLYDEGLIF